MTTIKPDARDRFTAEDFEFIAKTLATSHDGAANLAPLLTDESARDAALDTDKLLRALLESPESVRISPQLYFYVLARCCLKNFDRSVADYVANLLTAFIDTQRLKSLPEQTDINPRYVTEMLTALRAVSSERAFYIRAQLGNYSLFLSGVFPDHIRHQAARRGAPDIRFYEEVGSQNYRLAADHRLAHANALDSVYRTISDHFSEVRVGVNRLSDQLLCFEPHWNPSR